MIIEVNDLRFSYYPGQEVLKGLTFSADKGEMVYILGPNGVGKSTLFRCLLGQTVLSGGEVKIYGKNAAAYTSSQLAAQMAYIPQVGMPSFNYSVREMAVMGRTVHLSPFASPSPEDYRITDEVLHRLGIDALADRGIEEISGGERQLMLIARALVQQSRILIMDEPTANLDYGNQIRVQASMKKLVDEGLLILQSSHNPQHALLFADKVIALKNGQIVAVGSPLEVITEENLYLLYGLRVKKQGALLVPDIEAV